VAGDSRTNGAPIQWLIQCYLRLRHLASADQLTASLSRSRSTFAPESHMFRAKPTFGELGGSGWAFAQAQVVVLLPVFSEAERIDVAVQRGLVAHPQRAKSTGELKN
jgi:hypothetical protein